MLKYHQSCSSWSATDLVSCQLVIKAAPAQLLLLFGQHPSSLLFAFGLLLGHIVTPLLLKLGPLYTDDLAGVLPEGGPIQNVQRQVNLCAAALGSVPSPHLAPQEQGGACMEPLKLSPWVKGSVCATTPADLICGNCPYSPQQAMLRGMGCTRHAAFKQKSYDRPHGSRNALIQVSCNSKESTGIHVYWYGNGHLNSTM